MKPFVLLFLLFLAGCSPSPKQPAASVERPVNEGRFRIVTVRDVGTSGREAPYVIKLDSITGQTWTLQSGTFSSSLPSNPSLTAWGWEEIPTFQESIAKIRGLATYGGDSAKP